MEGKNGNGHGGARAGARRKRKIAGTTAETIQGLEVPGTVLKTHQDYLPLSLTQEQTQCTVKLHSWRFTAIEDPQPDNVDEAGDDPSENGFQKEYLKSIRDQIMSYTNSQYLYGYLWHFLLHLTHFGAQTVLAIAYDERDIMTNHLLIKCGICTLIIIYSSITSGVQRILVAVVKISKAQIHFGKEITKNFEYSRNLNTGPGNLVILEIIMHNRGQFFGALAYYGNFSPAGFAGYTIYIPA
ncbi:hypothetical protein BT96DRAFT_947561 [Gymnopus androsaceus JB14]|uniref:Uncharacterized protein n=1 Tax=Gymnopus androsaceus JB14 TaxID=1447944 RepID=A0A6A4GRY1_9AGAR|nr:hypothetical protein BT96DRAFT_947561 [Gymnopus androsaceus JB14]